jgi:hypothetical protein
MYSPGTCWEPNEVPRYRVKWPLLLEVSADRLVPGELPIPPDGACGVKSECDYRAAADLR